MTRQITAAIAEIQNVVEEFAPRAQGVTATDKRPGWFFRMVSLPVVWMQRKRDRWILAELSDAQLRDVGLNAYDVRWECTKGFWRG